MANLYAGSDLYSGRDRATVSFLESRLFRRLFSKISIVFCVYKEFKVLRFFVLGIVLARVDFFPALLGV